MRRALTLFVGFIYWVWTSAALVAAWLTRVASDHPPFDEENRIFLLALASWLFGSVLLAGLVLRWRAAVVLGLWLLQAGLLGAAAVAAETADFVRVAPQLYAIGAAAQAVGFLVAVLNAHRHNNRGGTVAVPPVGSQS
jgi:hypothetical protein